MKDTNHLPKKLFINDIIKLYPELEYRLWFEDNTYWSGFYNKDREEFDSLFSSETLHEATSALVEDFNKSLEVL